MTFTAFIRRSFVLALISIASSSFASANLENGKAIDQQKCYACHAKKTGFGNGDYSVITRDDGKKQLAYKGMPLYFWVKDTKPGDKTGDGFLNGAWKIVKM
ncbi:COG4315 family predicted lipoprotein [Polynucleobacter paneuropaeus]|uniref:COG4315 family predicted lipoprotein n=1 Tax=Polynucleobacter paneuropaeus TaxID=2527775 RepID=UPI001CEF640F|nr:hypothetical protein [Polynucleobacter paneuropaeus]